MSLRGRYVIDRLKRSIGKYIRLPVPPYGQPTYWDGVYQSLGPDDVFEWGNVSFRDLKQYKYEMLQGSYEPNVLKDASTTVTFSSSWGETIGVLPTEKDRAPILMLGCGNSSLGEDMIQDRWEGPIWQVDVSARIIDAMSQRCSHSIENGDMQFVQDDATVLSAFSNNQVCAVIDKGLIDALFCADQFSKCQSLMQAVHRVLQPHGVFCCLSLSYPAFIHEHLLMADTRRRNSTLLWKDAQIRLVNNKMILYRFQKEGGSEFKASGLKSSRSNKSR